MSDEAFPRCKHPAKRCQYNARKARAALAASREREQKLREALISVIEDIETHERPSRKRCWDSVARADAVLAETEET